MQIIYRGNEIEFTANPLDEDGDPVVPDSMSLYLNYVTAAGRVKTDPMAMSVDISGDGWMVTWDTSGIGVLPGLVYYTVRAVSPNADADGSFYLDAFPSNPAG